jgi:hypothetical protein
MIGPKGLILTVTWGIDEFHVIDMMPPGGFNSDFLLTHMMDPWLVKAFPKRGKAMRFD